MKRIILIVCALCLCLVGSVSAQTASNPPQAAENIRQGLFDAQVALMGGDSASAVSAVQEGQQLYRDVLSESVASVDVTLDQLLIAQFAAIEGAGRDGDLLAFAALRGQIWTKLLQGSAQTVYAAIADGDSATAALWLPLRDFRLSTRFSRPGVNATLAVSALQSKTLSPEKVEDAVRADLLDSYQAQLMASLVDADEAGANGFDMRRAEEAGLAAGYFDILAAPYGEQLGEIALIQARNSFVALVVAASEDDATAFMQAREQIDEALTGFRAAPLSGDELARRAGQLVRFISLVPIEYARGVRNGVVTSDIEIQEAVTFHQGAVVAFTDIRETLAGYDGEATARVSELLTRTQTQIREVADPAALQATVDEAMQLLTATIPAEWLETSVDSDIDVILSILDQVETAAAQGEYQLAESARLEAYALLELGLEQRLRGFAADLAVQVESLFWQGTPEYTGLAVLLANKAEIGDIRATLRQLEAELNTAQTVLNGNSAPAAVISNAAIIVFREGLEAVLILASLLASLRTAEEQRYRRPLLAGAALAFATTALTWILANSLLTVLLPLGERLEAIVSLIAIGVLLLITNWFFHKVYWTGWMANFHSRKRQLVGGVVAISISQTIGLMVLGFTSIYREGFETVLFLQSLVLEAGVTVVLEGVALGLLGTAVVGVIAFALQVRLPYKKMLVVTGVMIGVVLLTMVGHTVHVMQSVGWLAITPLPDVFLPYWMGQWFGLFATLQGIGLQIAAAVFVIGSYFLAERQNKTRRSKPGEERQVAAS
jgi:high-affinity iron transporter